LIKLLQSRGIDVNAKDNTGNSALHYACSRDDKHDIVSALLSLGADVKATNAKNQSVLACAIDNIYQMKVPMMLIKAGANLDIHVHKTLESKGFHELMKCRNDRMLKFLVEKNIDRLPEINEEFLKSMLTNYQTNRAINLILFMAKKRGLDHEILWNLFFEKISSSGNDVAQIVFKNGDYELIKFLAAKGVKLEYKNNYNDALDMAAEAGNECVLKYLLEDVKMKADSEKIQKLIDMVRHNSVPAMTYLMEKLGETDEARILKNAIFRMVDEENIEDLNELMNHQKTPEKKHDCLMSILNTAAQYGRGDLFKSTLNTFGSIMDSEDIQLIDKNGWRKYLD